MISKKDKHILFEIEKNSRSSLSKIAKKSGMSKQLLFYKIKKFMKLGFINRFETLIDVSKLGFSTFSVYMQLSNQRMEESIIKRILTEPSLRWITTCAGRWDIMFSLSSKSFNEFMSILARIMEDISEFVNDYETGMINEIVRYGIGSILGMNRNVMKVKEVSTGKEIDLDEKDISILMEITNNSRIKSIDIARKLNITIESVVYRIKKLKKIDVIKYFTFSPNFQKLGYNWYQVLIDIKGASKLPERVFERIDGIYYMVFRTGKWDLEAHIFCKSNTEFRNRIIEIRNSLGSKLKSYDINMVFEKYKSTCIPEIIKT